jgi:alanyl-tRNA synthetase
MANLTVASHTLVAKAVQESSRVTFASGSTKETTKVVDVAKLADGKVALLLANTPFHPVDQKWPDQPADRGTIQLGQKVFQVLDCQIYGVHSKTQEMIDGLKLKDIRPLARPEWHSVVGHIIDCQEASELVGQEVVAQVDAKFREDLSLHHTASHLAAFAFNKATSQFWKKEPRKDSLQNPDTDQAAIESATIFADRNEDRYRFGDSIRKKGLQVDDLFKNVEQIKATVNQLVNEWIKTGAKVEINAEGPYLNSTRKWRCQLPEGLAEMPCGGTHMPHLGVYAKIDYALNIEPGVEKRLLGKITVERAKT